MEDLVDEAVQGLLVEDITEELPEVAKAKKNEDTELPQIYVIEKIPKPLHAEDLDLPQVHNVIDADQLEQPYNGGLYVSPINQWIESSCAQFDSSQYNLLFPDSLIFQFSFIHEQIARHSYLMMNIFLLSLTKQRKGELGIDEMLEWLHYLYAYT